MRRRFRPRWVPTLAVVLLFPAFAALGYWQLRRAEEKQALQADYDARAFGPAVPIEPRLQRAEALRFYRVVARGVYDTEYQLLIDDRVHRGVAGYHVITPLRIQGGEVRVLVNRGWVPWGESRERLPAIDVPAGSQKIEGIATVPSEKVFTLGRAQPVEKSPPTLWPYLDLKRYRESVPFPVQPVVVLLDPGRGAGGYVREWNRLDTGVAVHQGYAFQWFTLAAGVLVVYLVLSWRGANARRDREDREKPDV